MKILLTKALNSLRPADETAEQALQGIKHGDVVSVEIKRPRNLLHSRKFFAMLQIVFDNQEHYTSLDDLRAVCLCEIGHCNTVQRPDGYIKYPRSMNFASLDQDEFNALYDKAVTWVCSVVIPGLSERGLSDEVATELRSF